MQHVLATLKDIDGVVGSFVVDTLGQVVGRDMPRMFEDAALAAAGARLTRLKDALQFDGAACDSCITRFGPYLLIMRTAGERTLCVLVPQGTNLNALNMGANLVARAVAKLPPTPTVQVSTPAPPPLPNPAKSALTQPTTPASDALPGLTRMFRGRRVG